MTEEKKPGYQRLEELVRENEALKREVADLKERLDALSKEKEAEEKDEFFEG
ncbi:hypothetical protein HY572_00985 [Candidatus Micrarchaeota archaeon]|nr:hypothetical protein [Candidatus Micrarchaeota archaeon]